MNEKTKEIEIREGENIYKFQIEIINEFLQVSIYDNNILINKGDIHITKTQSQICTFNDYSINEIFEEINKLKYDKFAFIKEENILQI